MDTRYFVFNGRRRVRQYASLENATKHASSIGGTVKELPFQAQYERLTRGGRRVEYGTPHSSCSARQAALDGVFTYEAGVRS